MKKYFIKIPAFLLTLAIVFSVSGFVFSGKTQAHQIFPIPSGGCPEGHYATTITAGETPVSACEDGDTPEEAQATAYDKSTFWGALMDALAFIPGFIAAVILKIASLLTYLAGALLNLVVQYTVVDMKMHLDGAGTVNNAWKVIRDVANMAFIFVLLYAAIQTILGVGKDTKGLIVKIIVVAILINFSLFFTRVVIDISNVLAMTFYDAIAPGALTGNAQGILGKTGIADSLMKPLSLTSIWDIGANLEGRKLLTIGVMGTVVTLIAAFVFFAVALMFIIRFVVLIFVLVLSPIAFIAFILPQAEKYRDQWKDALIGQAFFAPIYFMLTWIVIVISRGLLKGNGTLAEALGGSIGASGQAQAPSPDSLGVLMNFIIMIVLLIASLTIAKEWANKAPGAVGKLTSWATGAAGGATLGLAGRFGRNTIGAGADRLAQSERLQRWAGKSLVGEKVFQGTKAAAKSSFDFRATRAGGATVGTLDVGQAQQGGFEAKVQKKTEAREKFAQTLRAPGRAATATTAAIPSAKEAYAARVSRGPLTSGGTQNSANTIMGALGRHNRVAASKILNSQLAPLETQEQNLQTRETQLNQQLANMTNEEATLRPLVAAGTATPQQVARLTALQDVTAAVPPGAPAGTPPVPTNRNSMAYAQHQLNQTQANLTRVSAETTRIKGIITANRLTNPANQIVNPVTGTSRPARADEQNY